MDRTIRVCQNKTCRKQGSKQVLAAFERSAPEGVTVEESGCLGHCGSGPNVLILPENEWLLHVQPSEAEQLVNARFELEKASDAQSDANKVFALWLLVIVGVGSAIALITLIVMNNSQYV